MERSLDRDARFNRIFELHHRAVQAYCLRRLPAADVNDATAEVFLVAWRHIDQVPKKDLPWLYGISRNVVRNAHRSRRRRIKLQEKISGLGNEPEPGPEIQLLQHYDERAVLDALATLTSDDQEVLRLKTWEELSNGDIARVLDTSVHAVDMRVSRARKRLARAHAKLEPRSAAGRANPVTGGR
jgi:RNA polymerase sigma-70 factor (ECF subfamily)